MKEQKMNETNPITYSNKHIKGFDEIQYSGYSGYWIITSSFHVWVITKPNWLNRQMTRLLLGWKWEDYK